MAIGVTGSGSRSVASEVAKKEPRMLGSEKMKVMHPQAISSVEKSMASRPRAPRSSCALKPNQPSPASSAMAMMSVPEMAPLLPVFFSTMARAPPMA